MRSDVALSAICRVVTVIVGVAISIMTARTLGVQGRGEYFYVVTIALLATQLSNFGLSSSNTYLAARDSSLMPALFVNSVWVSLVAAPIAVAVIILAAASLPSAGEQTLKHIGWAALLSPVALLFLLGGNLLVGVQDFARYNAISIAAAVLRLALFGLAAILAPSVETFLAVLVITTFASSVAVAIVLIRTSSALKSPWPNLRLLQRAMGPATRAFLTLVLAYLLSRMPVIALGINGDTRSIGIVSIVLQFLDVLAILPASVAMVLFPQLVSGHPERWKCQTIKATAWVFATMVIACGILAVASTPVVNLLYGRDFEPAAQALRWALPGAALLGAVNVFGQYLAATGFPVSTVIAWGLAACIGFVLSPTEAGEDAARHAAQALTYAYAFLAVAMATLFVRRVRSPDSCSAQ